jgi:hypothetical protein
MSTTSEYRVELTAHHVRRNTLGGIVYHPLNHLYREGGGKKYHYGDVAFAGQDLDESDQLDAVWSYWLKFYGDPDNELDREAWADQLRIAALRNLCRSTGHVWYITFEGDVVAPQSSSGWQSLEDEIKVKYVNAYQLPYTIVDAVEDSWLGVDFRHRLFVEYSADLVAQVLARYLPRIYPRAPFEGCLMPAGQIDNLSEWNAQPRNDLLF